MTPCGLCSGAQEQAARERDRELLNGLRERHREELRLFRETQEQQLDIARDVARRQTEDAMNLYGDQLSALRELYDADLIDLADFQGRRSGFIDTRDDEAREAREAFATVESMLAQQQADLEQANAQELDELRRSLEEESAARSSAAASALAGLRDLLAREQAALEEAQALELAELEGQIAMEREARELESEERIAAERLRLQMEYERAVADAALAAAERSIMIIQNLVQQGIITPLQGLLREFRTLQQFAPSSPCR